MQHASSPALDDSSTRNDRTRMHGLGRAALAFVRANVLVLSIGIALLLIYTLAGFFLVPRIARSQLDAFVTGSLQQRVTVGELRFNPFTFEASVQNLRLTEPSGRELVGFRHLYVNAEIASLWQRAIVMKEISISAPSINLVVERDGSVNLKALRPPTAATNDPADAGEPTPVRIGTFSLREGRIAIADNARARPFSATIAPIRFSLTDFKTDAGHRNGYRFAGTTQSGERLDWQGDFTVQPLGSTGEFNIQGLRMATLESYVEAALPFRLAAGQADLNGNYRFELEPFDIDVTLPKVALRDIALAERGQSDITPIEATSIDLQQTTMSLRDRTVNVAAIDIRDARVEVARERDGTISLTRLFAPTQNQSSAAPSPAEPTERAPAWHAGVDVIRVANATVRAEDRVPQTAVRLELASLNASVEHWHNGPDAKIDLAVDTAVNSAGKLAIEGAMQLQPLSGDAQIDLASFDLAVLQPYVAQAAQMTVHRGALSIQGRVGFAAAPNASLQSSFKGDVRVADLRTTDDVLKQDFIKWRSLALSGIAYTSEPAALAIERIAAVQPYANVTIAEDGTFNVSQILSTPGQGQTDQRGASASTASTQSASAPVARSKPMPIAVRLVQVEQGSANFADRSIEPSFAAKIVGLQGKVTGLSSAKASRAKVALVGKVDDYAPVDITGDVNLLAATKFSDIALNFRNMELTSFNPYSGKFAGYNISKGKLSTELKYRIEERKLQADHHVVLDNLEFGAKTDSKDAAPIPIKLGVALLKDRNGVIDVNLPVSGTLDDPKFKLGPIVWKAVLGLLTKIVTAPFAALGALFGGGDELAYLDFAPGSAALSASETTKLTTLAKALSERPALRLDVPITAASAADGVALAKAALAVRIPNDAAIDAADESGQGKRLTVYEQAYRSLIGQPPAYPAELAAKDVPAETKRDWLETGMLARLQPDVSALDALSRERARAVQATLLANAAIDPERIFITTDRVAALTPEGAVRMELKLE